MKLSRYLLSLALVISGLSCHVGSEFSDPDAAYSTSLIHEQLAIASPTPYVFLLVADDANTLEAAALRERLPQALRHRLVDEVREHWTYCANGDPARWHPGDTRVVVARPSAPSTEVLLTWVDAPNLAWITNTSKQEEVDTIITATDEALAQRLAKPEESYRPLRAATRTIDLITGTRAPENNAESEFIGTLPQWFTLEVIVANTREDEDASPIENLLPIQTMNETSWIANLSMIGPSASGSAFCDVYPLSDSRLERWAERMNARFIAWPCNHQDTWDGILQRLSVSCGTRCYGHPPVILSDGSAKCRAFIDQVDLDKCDPSRGWSDPGGTAIFAHRWGIRMRQCEIMQHMGANLNACRHSLECPNCGSGFCVTEFPGLVLPEKYCPGSDVPWSMRFTGGSLATPQGLLHVFCDTGIH